MTKTPFRLAKDCTRIACKCYYCDAIYYMHYEIIGNALMNHYIVEHPDKVNKQI